MIDNPLAQYASPDMIELWTPDYNVRAERRLWIEVIEWMRHHTGVYSRVENLDRKMAAYTEVSNTVDLESIRRHEVVTKHDLKARIHEFNELAEEQYRVWTNKATDIELIHWGMTSADVVDNITLVRMLRSLEVLLSYAPDSLHGTGFWHLDNAINMLPFRGIKGPVGTQQDMLDLIGDADLVRDLDEHLASFFGFESVLDSVGQVYPRSLDFMVGSYVAGCVMAESNSWREPWKTVLNGYNHMIMEYSGSQWNEGDVSTSVIRRVALPGLFLAADAALRGIVP